MPACVIVPDGSVYHVYAITENGERRHVADRDSNSAALKAAHEIVALAAGSRKRETQDK